MSDIEEFALNELPHDKFCRKLTNQLVPTEDRSLLFCHQEGMPSDFRELKSLQEYFVQVISTEDDEEYPTLRKIHIHDGKERIFIYAKKDQYSSWTDEAEVIEGSVLEITSGDLIRSETNPLRRKNILAGVFRISVTQKECDFLVDDWKDLSIIDQKWKRQTCWKCKGKGLKKNLLKSSQYLPWTCDGSLQDEGCSHYLIKDKLTSFWCENCSIRTCAHCINHYGNVEIQANRKRKLEHADDLISTLWKDKESTGDIEIKTSNGILKAHRSILSSKPSFFKLAIAAQMREAVEGVIDLSNLANTVEVNKILEWIYFGALTAYDGELHKLFKLAAYCQLSKMVEHVGKRMVNSISEENVTDTLNMLQAHGGFEEVRSLRERFLVVVQKNKKLLKHALFPSAPS